MSSKRPRIPIESDLDTISETEDGKRFVVVVILYVSESKVYEGKKSLHERHFSPLFTTKQRVAGWEPFKL